MKTKKIIRVLKFIKSYCGDRTDCAGCIFANEHEECFTYDDSTRAIPTDWDLNMLEINLLGIEKVKKCKKK